MTQPAFHSLAFDRCPNFSRLRTALKRGMPDRTPIMELAVDLPIKEKLLGRKLETIQDEVDFWYQAGYDYALIRAGYDIDNLFPGAYDAGTGHAPPPIKTITDIEQYPWKKLADVDQTILDDAAKCLPEGMKMISGEGGFFSFSWMLMGMENFCLHYNDPDGPAIRVLKKVCDLLIEINRTVAAHPAVGAVWIGDDLAYKTSLMVSPQWFRQWVFPYYARIGELCRRYNKPFIFHSDGDIRPVMKDLIDIGVDAIHPIEPAAMDIEEIKREYGRDLALIGNIDLVHTLPYGSPKDVKQEVADRIRTVGYNGGYCISSANSITHNIPLKNYIAMINAAYEYGQYT